MKTDELAFFNQQLAVMLREGIPLEGAIRQLVTDMRRGPLRDELDLLQEDLARGTPLGEAVARRELPVFYSRMLAAGAASQEMPAMLTLLADHYHRTHAAWTRMKGLMMYPLIVILVAFLLSAAVSVFFGKLVQINVGQAGAGLFGANEPRGVLLASLWLSPVVFAMLALVCLIGLSVPSFRAHLRWRLPPFRETSLAQLASSMALMLRNGVPLPEALALAESLEAGTPAAPALASWRQQLAAGKGRPADWQQSSDILPPLFLWLVKSSGEDMAAGFQKAGELYGTRAAYRTELMLYGILPVSVLLLGQMIFWQAFPAIRFLIQVMDMIGSVGD